MTFRIAGISFDHMHMGDLLRMVHEHPDAEIAALYDPNLAKMQGTKEANKCEIRRYAPQATPRTKPDREHPVTPGLVKVYQPTATDNKTDQHHDKKRFQRPLVHKVAADKVSRGCANS